MQKNLKQWPPAAVLAGAFLLSAFPFLAVELFPSRLYRVMDVPSYLIFHNVAEFFSVMVSLSIFGAGWHTYDQSRDRHTLFLSSAFLAVGLMDFMHALSYAGMPSFITPNSANKSTQFWIAVRLFSASAFLASAFIRPDRPGRWLSKPALMTASLAVTGLAFAGIIFFPSSVPATYAEGIGLTPFKRSAEYLIICLLLFASAAYWGRFKRTGDRLLIYYLAAFVLCMFSELVFAVYTSAFDTYNVLGHVYKVIAFTLIYKSIFIASVTRPYAKLSETSEQLRLDIIDRKQAEERVRKTRDEWERTFNAITDPIMILDTGHRIVKANSAMAGKLGVALPAMEGKTCFTLVHGTAEPPPFCPHSLLLVDGRSRSVEISEPRLNGHFLVAVSPLYAPGGELDGSIHYVRDITGRKQAEEALKESEKKFRELAELLPQVVFEVDVKGDLVYANRHAFDASGYAPGDVEKGLNARQLVVPEDRARLAEDLRRKLDGEETKGIEYTALRKDGSTFPIVVYSSPVMQGGKPAGLRGIIVDITERKRAEQALQESKQRYRRLVESVTDYIYTVTVEDGRPVETAHGPGCIAVTGYRPEDYAADPYLWIRMIHEEDRRAVLEQAARILSGAAASPLEHRIVHRDGSVRWIKNTPVPRTDDAGRLTAYDGLISDITERKNLEGQLRQAQKMEAVGQLAGGIAHDFNNILTAIIGYGHILQRKMARDDELRAHSDRILEAADRAARLVRNLLAFGRKQVLDLHPADLNGIVQRVEDLLKRVMGEDIELRTTFRAGPVVVNADQGQIEQALMNLATNARDAMPQGGVFGIETDTAELDGEFIRTHGFGDPGKYAVVSATDTGTGMDEATQKRIFDPFFTTKETGRGTGLGLSIVYGIVKQHKGYVTVSSEPGKGTTFTIYLPLARATSDVAGPRAAALAKEIPGGTETILVAEDDDALRELTRAVLTDFGYQVIDAQDGEEAIIRFREHEDAVRLVLLDMVMPKKSGREAYDEIRKTRPDVKVLFMSGYAADKLNGRGAIPEGVELIRKPLLPQDLLRRVREVLDS